MENHPNVLVIEHAPPGKGGEFNDLLVKNQADFHVVRMCDNDPFPAFGEYDGMILGGGLPSVCEIEKPENAFLKREQQYLLEAIQGEVPVLGVCLGHQLLADAFGGKVSPNNASEYGWIDITLTREGLEDPLFAGVKNALCCFEYHNDTVTVQPDGVVVLALSSVCPYQAFRYRGKLVWSIQFHPEFSGKWAEMALSYTHATLEGKGFDVGAMIAKGCEVPDEPKEQIIENFVKIVKDVLSLKLH